MRPTSLKSPRLITALTTFTLFAQPLAALNDDFQWTTPAPGDFNDPANWSLIAGTGTSPETDDAARFNQPGTYTVSFNTKTTTINKLDITNGNLTLQDNTTPSHALLNVDLTAFPDPAVNIAAPATLTIDALDLDTTGPTNLDGTLNIINSANLHTAGPFNNAPTATLNINGAAATFDTPWTLAAQTSLNNANITGSPITATAPIDASGFSNIDAPITFTTAGSLNVQAGAILFLNNGATFNAPTGTYTGPGELIIEGTTTVQTTTNINTTLFNLDGDDETTTVNLNAPLNINTDKIDLDSNNFDGTLNINNTQLTLNNTADQWTIAGQAHLNAAAGTAQINGAPLTITGTLQATGPNTAAINTPTTFANGATITLNNPTDTLTTNSPATFQPGATASGNGTLITNDSLTLQHNATPDINIQANGPVHTGDSPGAASIRNLTLNTTASLNIEVQNPTTSTPLPGTDHDQLTVTEQASFNGTLNIELLSPESRPALGTNYPAVPFNTRAADTFFHTVTGATFPSATDFALPPLLLSTDDDDIIDTLVIRATIPGDLNLDNKVSVADLSSFALAFGTTPGLYSETLNKSSWQLGDFNLDGKITVADLSLLALNFGFTLLPDGTTTPPTPLSMHDAAFIAGLDYTAIPEPASAAMITFVSIAFLHSRKYRMSS